MELDWKQGFRVSVCDPVTLWVGDSYTYLKLWSCAHTDSGCDEVRGDTIGALSPMRLSMQCKKISRAHHPVWVSYKTFASILSFDVGSSIQTAFKATLYHYTISHIISPYSLNRHN